MRYRTIFENTGSATILIEEDMTISLANQEFERITGVPKKETEGKKNFTEFFIPLLMSSRWSSTIKRDG
jgi:PAS domain S-box-containing protein